MERLPFDRVLDYKTPAQRRPDVLPTILHWLMKRRLFILSTLSLLLFIAVVIVCQLSYVNFADGYAKWDAATLLIEYMETHDGQWPKGWDDLRDTHAWITGEGRTHERGIWSPGFEEIRSRVGIDWSADPEQLATATPDHAREPFRVVWALSGTTTTITEPNQLILDYLRERPTTRRPWCSSTSLLCGGNCRSPC